MLVSVIVSGRIVPVMLGQSSLVVIPYSKDFSLAVDEAILWISLFRGAKLVFGLWILVAGGASWESGNAGSPRQGGL